MKRALETAVRVGDRPESVLFLLRGGVYADEVRHLQRQAADFDRLYTWRAGSCFGISVFAVTGETEAAVLESRMGIRRHYRRIRYRDIEGSLTVVPTFRAPHWTVMFDGPHSSQYEFFVDCYGELRENPYWSRQPLGRRPR